MYLKIDEDVFWRFGVVVSSSSVSVCSSFGGRLSLDERTVRVDFSTDDSGSVMFGFRTRTFQIRVI